MIKRKLQFIMDTNKQDIQFRKILSETKQAASSNLKWRVLQQIETEKSLARKKTKNSSSVIVLTLSVFGAMYAILALIGISSYLLYGIKGIESTSTLILAGLVASVCSTFWLISIWDEKRKY